MSTQQTAKTQFVETSKGTKFGYRRLGTGPGVPVVLLTHFRGTQDKWDPLLLNTLAASRPLITVDYAGVGHSTGEVATTVRQSADNIIEFLGLIDEVEIDLLGFSMGGMVAQLISLNADPNTLKVRKLILAGTSTSAGEGVLGSPNDDVGAIAGGKDVALSTFQTLFFPKTKGGKLASEEWWARIHERNATTSGEETTTGWLSEGFLDQGKGLLAQVQQLGSFSTPETSQGLDGALARLGDLKIPVFVANGKNDYMLATANSFLIQQKVQNGQLIVYLDSGHGFLFQYATLFAKHVLLFLEA